VESVRGVTDEARKKKREYSQRQRGRGTRGSSVLYKKGVEELLCAAQPPWLNEGEGRKLLYDAGKRKGKFVGVNGWPILPMFQNGKSVTVFQVGPPGCFTHISITTPIVFALKNSY
jgi:hypothetical protein